MLRATEENGIPLTRLLFQELGSYQRLVIRRLENSTLSPENGQVVGGAPFTGYTFSVGIVKVQAVKALWESMI